MKVISVKRLKLFNFRNYENFDQKFGPEPVIITGSNGIGKTNLLEAISFLVPGRGIRNARLSEIDRRKIPELVGYAATLHESENNFPWAVYAEISTPNGEVTIGTGRDPASEDDKRIVRIDGESKRGQAELARYFAICYLTPQMDQTFLDGSSSRRAYLDRMVSVFFPDHVKHLSIYEHAKSERKRLLISHSRDEAWLAVLEQRMAEHSMAIAAARMETVSHVQKAINLSDNKQFPKAVISVSGTVEQYLENLTALRAEEKFRIDLQNSRKTDQQSGRASIGTHRSDFVVYHSVKNMPAELCSTGEQKALLLSITIACAKARKEWFGAPPVLLLDEVVSHLDGNKRRALFHEINDLQVQSWLTGTDSDLFEGLKGVAQFINF